MNEVECRRAGARENEALLPERAFNVHPGNGGLIELRRGESGYIPWTVGKPADSDEPLPPMPTIAQAMNDQLGVTPAQAEAMLNGSLFGWHVAAANVAEIERLMANKH